MRSAEGGAPATLGRCRTIASRKASTENFSIRQTLRPASRLFITPVIPEMWASGAVTIWTPPRSRGASPAPRPFSKDAAPFRACSNLRVVRGIRLGVPVVPLDSISIATPSALWLVHSAGLPGRPSTATAGASALPVNAMPTAPSAAAASKMPGRAQSASEATSAGAAARRMSSASLPSGALALIEARHRSSVAAALKTGTIIVNKGDPGS